MMTVEERIKICILIEKIHKKKTYSEKMGLEDISKLHGERIYREEEREVC